MKIVFKTGAGLYAAMLLAGTAFAQSGDGTIAKGCGLIEAIIAYLDSLKPAEDVSPQKD